MFKWGVIGTGSIANTVLGQITGSGRHRTRRTSNI